MSVKQRLRRLESGALGQSDRPFPRCFRIIAHSDDEEAAEKARLQREGMTPDDCLVIRRIVSPKPQQASATFTPQPA